MVLSLRPSKVKVTTDMTLKTSKTGISNQQQANAPLKLNSHTRNTTKKTATLSLLDNFAHLKIVFSCNYVNVRNLCAFRLNKL